MRPTAVIPLLLTLVALILSLLCIFAGSKRGFLENADLLTLNTSMLGHLNLNTPNTSSSFLNTLVGDIKGEINDVVTDVARTLNIHDFYGVHVLDYCEGFYTPSPIANGSEHPEKNVTHCSNTTSLFHFNPTAVIQRELRPGINLTDLKWPSAIEDGVRAVETASKVMFVLYCIGAAATGLALLGAILGVFAAGRLTAFLNILLALLGFLALGIASALSTTIIVKVVNSVNKYGKDIGIAAYKGKTFLGMTWAATIMDILASFAWVFEIFRGRRK